MTAPAVFRPFLRFRRERRPERRLPKTGPARLALLLASLLFTAHASAGDLRTLIADALRTHPSARAQQALAGAAQAGVEGARWQFWPTPYVNVESAAGGSAAYPGDRSVATVGIRQPLWTGGRLEAGLERAQANAQAASAAQEQTRLQLALRVTQSYGEWRAAHLKLQAYEKGVQIHEELLARVVRRVEQGHSALSDQVLAEGRLASLQADLANARVQERIALTRLSQLLGRPVDAAALRDAQASRQAPQAPLPVLVEHAIAVSPALAQQRALAEAERATVSERRAELRPELQLRLERQQGSFSTPNAGGNNVAVIALSSRFGAGLSSLAGVDEAQARHAAALAEAEVQSREVTEQVMADHALLVQSQARRDALRAAIDRSQLVRESWDRQFQVGRKTWQDLMSSAREQVQVEAQWADLEAAQLVASWRLALMTQGVAAALADPA